MATDQAKLLRDEARTPHALYHQFALAQSKSAADAQFLFFEGVDDPVFFVGHIVPRLNGRDYYEFICNGRDGVIKVHELCTRDGRASDRTLFFIDKDHTDILGAATELPTSLFQTECYSFENYIVCKQVFRRFWTERLRLQSTDGRYSEYSDRFDKLHCSFAARMRLLMAIVLIGRGLEGRPRAKLNLNNVNLEKVISVDLPTGRVRWMRSGGQHFLAASNIKESGIQVRGDDVRRVYRTFLRDKDPKSYIRGKYELWFFVRFLAAMSRTLSDKQAAKATGLPRATPGEIICYGTCLDSLSGLSTCPTALGVFLDDRIAATVVPGLH